MYATVSVFQYIFIALSLIFIFNDFSKKTFSPDLSLTTQIPQIFRFSLACRNPARLHSSTKL